MRSEDSSEFPDGDALGRSQGAACARAPVAGLPARAADELLPAVYDELRAMAQSLLAGERPDHTLQATALVHEEAGGVEDEGAVAVSVRPAT